VVNSEYLINKPQIRNMEMRLQSSKSKEPLIGIPPESSCVNGNNSKIQSHNSNDLSSTSAENESSRNKYEDYFSNGKDANANTQKGRICFFVIDLLFHSAPYLVRSSLKYFIKILYLGIVANSRSSRTTFIPCVVSREETTTPANEENSGIKGLSGSKQNFDEDRSIYVSRKILNSMLIRTEQWVALSLEDVIPLQVQDKNQRWDKINEQSPISRSQSFETSTLGRTKNKHEIYLCQVFGIEETKDDEDYPHQFIKMTPTAYLNLRKKLGLLPIDLRKANETKFRIIPLVSSEEIPIPRLFGDTDKAAAGKKPSLFWTFAPLKAKSMKLSRLKSSSESSQEECDILLKEHFLKAKYVALNDIISIQTSHHLHSKVDFVVTELLVDNSSSSSLAYPRKLEKLYSVSSEYTSLYLTPQETNEFHVPIFVSKTNCARSSFNQPSRPSLSTARAGIVPKVLEPSLSKLQSLFLAALRMQLGHPIDNELWPTVLIHGGLGTGKFSICSSLAKLLGLNFYPVNGVSLVGDSSAYTEAKLKALGEKIKSILPCLIYIKNAHVCQ
jgi:hypothetical protein